MKKDHVWQPLPGSRELAKFVTLYCAALLLGCWAFWSGSAERWLGWLS